MNFSKDDIKEVLEKISHFNQEINKTFLDHGMSLNENIGRRNSILSYSQEYFFAELLKKKFPLTKNDGRTGYPDIVIPELNLEIECKFTSKKQNCTLAFQSDVSSFKNDKKTFLYVITDDECKNFAVLYFKNLTENDFSKESNGSRGKVSMLKHKTYEKCHVLYGGYEKKSTSMIKSIEEKILKTRKNTKSYQKLLERKKYWSNANNESFSVVLHSL